MKRYRVTLWIKGIDGGQAPFIYLCEAIDAEGAEIKARNEYEDLNPTDEILRGRVELADEGDNEEVK